MAHDVFVSYSSHDKLTADAVVAKLEAARLRCWIAPRDILPGMEWGEAIIDGIHRSRLMVLVFSSSANASPQIRREVERAVNKGLPIIPFRIEEILPSRSLEYFLSSPHWLDALTPPVEAHIERLADSVRALLARMDGAATQTAQAPPLERRRAKVQKVLDTMLGRPAPVVDTGPVPGLAAAPHVAPRRVTRPPAPPVAGRRVLAAFVILLAVVLGVLLIPRKPQNSRAPVSRRPTVLPTVPPTPATAASSPAVSVSSAASGPGVVATRADPEAKKPPKVRATYECRRGVKFSIDPDSAVVTMDGRRIGISDDFSHRAYAFSHAGTHYAKLSLHGYQSEWVKIVVRPGAEDDNAEIKLTLSRSY